MSSSESASDDAPPLPVLSQIRRGVSSLPEKERFLLVLLTLVGGLFFARDFGLSWDEYAHRVYAQQTLDTYLGGRPATDTVTDLRYYGPAFSVGWLVATNVLVRILSSLSTADAGHVVYWVAFVPSVFFLHSLARRIAGREAAFLAAALFLTQPAILGHAYINPKDTPFMTAFLATMWAGFHATDALASATSPSLFGDLQMAISTTARRILLALREASPGRKAVLFLIWIGMLLLVMDLFSTRILFSTLLKILAEAYRGNSWEILNRVFLWVAQDASKTSLSAYVAKADRFYAWSRFFLIGGTSAFVLALSRRLLSLPSQRSSLPSLSFLRPFVLAAVVAGLTSAVRVFGLFAAGLVVLLFLLRLRRGAVIWILLYGTLTLMVTYAAWPFLWGAPLQRALETLARMSNFPWQGHVLYAGQLYSVSELPWGYAVLMLVSKLTVPALLLGFAGLGVSFSRFRGHAVPAQMWLIWVWFGMPLAFLLALHPKIYDAFRQLLFVVPPFFLLASLGLDVVLSRLSRLRRLGLAGILLLPGVFSITSLHPYEYIYYNELVGGVGGAFRHYELDSWCTSYREAIEHVNAVAPRGTVVGIHGESHTIQPYLREDLTLTGLRDPSSDGEVAPGYAVGCTRGNEDLSILPDAEIVWSVEREGAALTVVKQMP